MQTTEDGEYIPAKELDTSFKIPRKRLHSEASNEVVPNIMYQQVLENPYYNYANYWQQQVTDAQASSTPVTHVSPYQIEAARNLIIQSLQKRNVEKPKTYQNHILEETIPDLFDDTLPRDLTALFQPLYCKLCSTQLSSNVVAKLHYKSKNHEKKIRQYLIDHSSRTGEPLHKRARITPKVKEVDGNDTSNPLYFYCDICDLPLTGKLHAESHYLGKNHRKATLGMKTPAGKGHYDESGKWVREGSSNQKRGLPSSMENDTFGKAFQQPPPGVPTVAMPPPAPGYRCELCNVTTTCKEQLESHYNGQKHRKKMKQANVTGVEIADKGDCSSFRTPSGKYYCHICNTTSNSEPQFKQHLHSKTHLKKATLKKA